MKFVLLLIGGFLVWLWFTTSGGGGASLFDAVFTLGFIGVIVIVAIGAFIAWVIGAFVGPRE